MLRLDRGDSVGATDLVKRAGTIVLRDIGVDCGQGYLLGRRRLFLMGIEGEPFNREGSTAFSHTIYLMTSGPTSYIQAVHETFVVFDGATGTNLQARDLGPDDFGGPSFEGCNELLCVTRPDVIADLHKSFFDVGCHVVETNSFGSIPWVLAEYGISERARELAQAAASIARDVADSYGGDRWVAGSLGPGTKIASLGQISFTDMRDGYQEAAAGLIAGGVDLLIIETVQDLLQAKAAIIACRRAMADAGRELPIQVQVTIETTGPHADGQRDRRRPHDSRRHAPRRHRAQLRHRPGRDGRARALSERAQPGPDLVPAQRRPALGGRRQNALRPHPGPAGRAPPPLRHRARCERPRRVLRDHPGPPEGRGGRPFRLDARPP